MKQDEFFKGGCDLFKVFINGFITFFVKYHRTPRNLRHFNSSLSLHLREFFDEIMNYDSSRAYSWNRHRGIFAAPNFRSDGLRGDPQ